MFDEIPFDINAKKMRKEKIFFQQCNINTDQTGYGDDDDEQC
ncbi:hypothetical protein DERP_001981 [Dermatophagoides pteronyssinus]|uniref:Uncharacterized protein n=1 Tax=Dermatophagoides pteronyssinus TaxID=6956 RepID=A0ABQ8JCK5_DERPT|nr:hypothetical protein DERP_001981 [Dermatophagoides pteronyssinus]